MVNAEASAEMLALLTSQTKTAKIPAGVPSGTATANKTGELADSGKLGVVENDIAIVFDKEHPYVLCVLSNNIKNNSSAQNTIKKISADVYTVYDLPKTKATSEQFRQTIEKEQALSEFTLLHNLFLFFLCDLSLIMSFILLSCLRLLFLSFWKRPSHIRHFRS